MNGLFGNPLSGNPLSALFGRQIATQPLPHPMEVEALRKQMEQQRPPLHSPYCPHCEHCKKVIRQLKKIEKEKANLQKEKTEDYKKRCKEWMEKLHKCRKK